jgi:hypothetical protein
MALAAPWRLVAQRALLSGNRGRAGWSDHRDTERRGERMNPHGEIRWAMASDPANMFTISAELFLFLAVQSKTEAEFRAAIYTAGHVEHERRSRAAVATATADTISNLSGRFITSSRSTKKDKHNERI